MMSGDVRTLDILVAVGWICFWLYWLTAATVAKSSRADSSRRGFVGIRLGVIAVVLALLRTPVLRGQSLAVDDALVGAIGVVLFLLGLAAAVWARTCLGTNWGTPMSQRVDPELITSGPYRYVRHPIYSGILLAMVGTALVVSLSWLVAVVLLGAYFVYSAQVEERNMAAQFPSEYPAYRSRTRLLIPFVL